ncbi:FAD-dependent oxidoreductase [Paenibacillus frigoriresistens]|uniref:NAD(P)/FAD-dependent oxidoreductase n=1 Tax=Paenibacillus alginolyticus TaxID=59839 RepID=UPI0015679CA6|nr:FAD-dependent oxidoreductase [Paenibacillus frigoriresistens]NRF94537.1 FAD-dependent oxidoreductase [Paenibacillus frigoriresistens]
MNYELVIIGAGISGIAAAMEAKANGVERLLVTDYEGQLGGFTRGLFGTGEFEVERELMRIAAELPFHFRYSSSVVGFFPGEEGHAHQINLQGVQGSDQIEAKRVLLCSGSLEKPREAHRIAGSRPAGVMTPIMAVNLLQRGYRPGENILVVGQGRLTSGTAKLLGESGSRVERLDGTQWEVTEILGSQRVVGIKTRNVVSGEERIQEYDTLVFSQRRIPCTFYLKGSEIERDEHHAVVIDEWGRTNIPLVSAAGSCTMRGDDDHRTSMELARQAMQALLKG